MVKFCKPSEQNPVLVTHIFLDFDGVMTDNSVYVDNTGNETVRCSKWDSWAIEQCKDHGYVFVVVSLESGQHVQSRARKLGIECHQGIHNKKQFLDFWCMDNNVPHIKCAYIGNDVADVEAMGCVLFSACPADSHPLAKEAATYTLKNVGGDGAIREFCDKFLVAHVNAS